MQIYLIRHTTPEINQDVCYGQADIELANSFEIEKDKILATINPVLPFDAVYSSPLKRCIDLANYLPGVDPVIDQRLLELNFGNWELTRWDEIDRQEFDFWANDFVARSPPNGESLESLYQRTESFIEYLLNQTSERIAVVTHAGVIRCFRAYITTMPLANVFSLDIDYGDIFFVTLAGDIKQSTIKKFNQTDQF